MNDAIRERLRSLREDAELFKNEYSAVDAYKTWVQTTKAFITAALGAAEGEAFSALGTDSYSSDWYNSLARMKGHLEGVLARSAVEPEARPPSDAAMTPAEPPVPRHGTQVFVVHGHDEAAKESVARFLEKLGLRPIILHEQPNEGRTVIEKFETWSRDVVFAVVLLTPDDLGAAQSTPNALAPRARQNVIMELGYFFGKLGRSRCCALYKPGLELPSDIQGVLYIEMDPRGAWRAALAQELSNAAIVIDVRALIQG